MKIEKAYKKMLIENPFYGLFLLGMSKVMDESIPTACVRKKGINCELAINPNFWESLDDVHQMSILQHEVYHIVFQHMFLYDLFPNKQLLNIAADCEVNSYIENVGEGWLLPSMWSLGVKKGTKYYYEELSKLKQQPQNNPIDSHDDWGKDFSECSDAEKQLIKNQINSQIKTAAEQTEKMRGTIPKEVEVIVAKILEVKPRIFNWKAYFRRMIGSIYDVDIKKTRRKESIRFKDSAGIKHKKKINLLVAIDTSGSVNNKELADFFSEITHIYKVGAKITILECDAIIHSIYEFTGKWEGKITGRGGTDFQPVIDYYRKNIKEYSSLIYFTDGECSLPINTPRDVIWVITSGGEHKSYPGKTLYIPREV